MSYSHCTALPPPARSEKLALLGVLALAFILRLLPALYLPTIHHPDEVFQYLEQGHRWVFGYGVVPWEYRDGARSWLVPGFLGVLMWLSTWIGGGAAGYLVVIAVVLSALSLSVVITAWLWARRLSGRTGAILAAAITASWFELVYFGSKPLTDALAMTTLFAAAYCLCATPGPSRSTLFIGGLLLGLTIVLRLQLSPATAVVALIGLFRSPIRSWLTVGFGAVLVVAMAGVLDWATWGYPFFSFWTNIRINLLLDKASIYGTSPWHWYFGEYIKLWSGSLVPIAILIVAGAPRAPLLLAVPTVILASHAVIRHKELRFVFAAIPFILLLAAIGTAAFVEAMRRAWPRAGRHLLIGMAILCWALTSLILAVGDHFRPNWTTERPLLAAMSDLRDRSSMCGLGLIDVPWYTTGGYTYLHRPIPIYPVPDHAIGTMRDAFNVALAPKELPLQPLGFHRERCYSDKACLFGRLGTCTAQPDRMISEDLRPKGASRSP
jgi:GPI mannosyltransferase 3